MVFKEIYKCHINQLSAPIDGFYLEMCPMHTLYFGTIYIEWWGKETTHSEPRSVSHARCSQITII